MLHICDDVQEQRSSRVHNVIRNETRRTPVSFFSNLAVVATKYAPLNFELIERKLQNLAAKQQMQSVAH